MRSVAPHSLSREQIEYLESLEESHLDFYLVGQSKKALQKLGNPIILIILIISTDMPCGDIIFIFLNHKGKLFCLQIFHPKTEEELDSLFKAQVEMYVFQVKRWCYLSV